MMPGRRSLVLAVALVACGTDLGGRVAHDAATDGATDGGALDAPTTDARTPSDGGCVERKTIGRSSVVVSPMWRNVSSDRSAPSSLHAPPARSWPVSRTLVTPHMSASISKGCSSGGAACASERWRSSACAALTDPPGAQPV